MNLLFVYVAHPDFDQAKQLARKCLDQKLIACANIFPQGISLYQWEGKVCEDPEWILILKTDGQHFPQLEEFIKQHHPYDCPCIMAIPWPKEVQNIKIGCKARWHELWDEGLVLGQKTGPYEEHIKPNTTKGNPPPVIEFKGGPGHQASLDKNRPSTIESGEV